MKKILILTMFFVLISVSGCGKKQNVMPQAVVDTKEVKIEQIIEKIKAVTPDDIQRCANKYFTDDFVTAVIKP